MVIVQTKSELGASETRKIDRNITHDKKGNSKSMSRKRLRYQSEGEFCIPGAVSLDAKEMAGGKSQEPFQPPAVDLYFMF